MKKYYFDYAATTMMNDETLNIYKDVSQKYYMNNINDESVYRLKEQVANKILELFNVIGTYEPIFTSGGTEANNLAILGKFKDSSNKHFITTKIEHPSVLETFKYLESKGNEVTYITPNKEGEILVSDVVDSIKKNTALISIMSVNNEIGTELDVRSIFKAVKEINSNILTMTDAVQAVGRIKIDLKYIDLLTLSFHKIYGPKGMGLLLRRKEIELDQLLQGSKSSVRPGTEAIGMQVASVHCLKEVQDRLDENIMKIKDMQNYFLEKIISMPVQRNGKGELGIISLTLNVQALSQTIAKELFDNNVVVSTRAACSQKSKERSHVLKAIGLTNEEIDKTIRISLSYKTTQEEIDILVRELEKVLKKFQ